MCGSRRRVAVAYHPPLLEADFAMQSTARKHRIGEHYLGHRRSFMEALRSLLLMICSSVNLAFS
jgi:hypothetical protein